MKFIRKSSYSFFDNIIEEIEEEYLEEQIEEIKEKPVDFESTDNTLINVN